MGNTLGEMYERHHQRLSKSGFSIMKEIRGKLISEFIGEGKTVLDIGCRDGVLTSYFSQKNTVTGADIDMVSLEQAGKGLGIKTVFMDLNGDWSELGGQKFDVVVAGEVLEHLYYPELVMDRVRSVLNPGGIFIGTVPNAFSLKNRLRYLMGDKRATPLADPTHINQFGYKDLRKGLESKFKNVTIIGLGRFEKLSRMFPNLVSFIMMFVCKD